MTPTARSITRIQDYIPEMLWGKVHDVFSEEIPREDNATCNTCIMCDNGQKQRSPDAKYFNPDTKCCTFHPTLVNYAVGGLLSDRDDAMAEGRKRILEKIDARIGVTPRGITPPRNYARLYAHLADSQKMGMVPSMLCPYFRSGDGACTVWRYRESVCSTWFCKHVKGADGAALWKEVKHYLAVAERLLSDHVLRTLGFELTWPDERGENIKAIDMQDSEGLPPPAHVYQALWGNWLGREKQFFINSFEIVSRLSQQDLLGIGGIRLATRADTIQKLRGQIQTPQLPDHLILNPDRNIIFDASGYACITTYNAYDPLRLPVELLGMLQCFDGSRSTEAALRYIADEYGQLLSKELLEKLYQFRVLVMSSRNASA